MNSQIESSFSAIFLPRYTRKINCGKYSPFHAAGRSAQAEKISVHWRDWRAIFLVSAFFLLPSAFLWAQSPAWWYNRGVIDTNLNANDYAPINQGQLKCLATNAFCEMEEYFGAGSNVAAVIGTFSSNNNYFPVNNGQVKYLAAPFYDRLYEFDLTNTMPSGMLGHYPWDGRPQTNDYALANIGQAKYVFSFDSAKDSDGDGLSDWLEAKLGTNPYNPDSDGDGLSDGWEVAHGTAPLDWDSDGDGLSDGWEVAHGGDPLDADNVDQSARTSEAEEARQRIIQHWLLFYGSTPTFTNTPGSPADLIDLKNALNALSGKFYNVE